MKRYLIKIIIIFLSLILFNKESSFSKEFLYILNDKCINELYSLAEKHFVDSDIIVLRDSRGIILRFELTNISANFSEISSDIIQKTKIIEYFLAKIENPVIIEVHTGNLRVEKLKNLRNWEISTVIANKIEDKITKPYGKINQDRINSVGYGEFLPPKNTPNNGGKFFNRVDIIILCNISGE